MSHYAKINSDNIVEQVIVAEQDFINTLPGHWIQTSYRTQNNQHPEQRPLRANFAGVGFTYNAENDVFIAPKPYASWQLDTATWSWQAPMPYPEGTTSYWDENTQSWIEYIESEN
jgi:hypothetical protein